VIDHAIALLMLELVIGGLILISFAEKRSIKPPSLRDVRREGLTATIGGRRMAANFDQPKAE